MQVARVGEKIGQLARPRRRSRPELGENRAAQCAGCPPPPRQQGLEAREIAKGRIAAEQFVAAEARQRDRDAARARGLAGVIGVDAVAGGLVVAGEKAGQVGGDARAGQELLVVLGVEGLRGEARGGLFGKPGLAEHEGEGL